VRTACSVWCAENRVKIEPETPGHANKRIKSGPKSFRRKTVTQKLRKTPDFYTGNVTKSSKPLVQFDFLKIILEIRRLLR